MGMNLYALHLRSINMDFRYDTSKCVLITVNNAIEEAKNNIDRAKKVQNEDYFDSIVDEETSIVEELLGAAFVVCQSYITSIVSSFIKLHKHAETDNLQLSVTSGQRKILLKTGSVNVAESEYTEIQIIDAFANYYKHCDQWPLDWNRARGQSKDTIEVIQSVGAQSGSSGNMRTGAKALGCSMYNNLDSLLDKITQWKGELIKQYQAELKGFGVL
jgi:hypothetical protein